MDPVSDEEIIVYCRKKETERLGFNLLVQKYQKRIYFVIRRMVIDHDDADDLTQETFVKTWNNFSTFREEAKLYTWIYRIAVNETLTFLGNKRKRLMFRFQGLESSLSNSLKDEQCLSGDDIQYKLQKAILRLPDKQRLVFNLKYFDELKYEDMSEILHTSVGALKASYHHAVKKIEEYVLED